MTWQHVHNFTHWFHVCIHGYKPTDRFVTQQSGAFYRTQVLRFINHVLLGCFSFPWLCWKLYVLSPPERKMNIINASCNKSSLNEDHIVQIFLNLKLSLSIEPIFWHHVDAKILKTCRCSFTSSTTVTRDAVLPDLKCPSLLLNTRVSWAPTNNNTWKMATSASIETPPPQLIVQKCCLLVIRYVQTQMEPFVRTLRPFCPYLRTLSESFWIQILCHHGSWRQCRVVQAKTI